MTHPSEARLQGWGRIKSEIEALLADPQRRDLRATAVAFVAAAGSIPPPEEVGLGYWGTSIRLIWPNCEAEVFVGSVEVYRIDPRETRIETWPFHVGEALNDDAVAALSP